MAEEEKIDEDRYSRQLYVIGHEAQGRMATSSVLIVGLTGVGVEIAKNVILSGVKAVKLVDDALVQWSDLSSQFYLKEEDVGTKSRAEASLQQLIELNPNVNVTVNTADILKTGDLSQFKVVVLCDQPLHLQLEVDTKCHELGVRFLAASTRGVFGSLFADYGKGFTVVDDNGEAPRQVMISAISKENPPVVTCLDEQRHDFETGDYTKFTEVKGMTEINGDEPRKVTVSGPYTFTIDADVSSYGDYEGGGWAIQVKLPKTVDFEPLSSALENPEYLIADFAKFDRVATIHACFQALDKWTEKSGGTLPQAGSASDAEKFLVLVKELMKDEEPVGKVVEMFARTCAGNLSPMAAAIGGVAGQEVIKAITGKFGPLKQFLYLDCTEVLPKTLPDEEACAPSQSRYDGQVATLGKELHEKIRNLRYFLVGAGAIGCEMLKNWAMMGVGTGPSGMIYVTDMDQIEKSNLSRQFLFRDKDLKKPKSRAAAAAIEAMNPEVKVTAYEVRVGHETEDVFDDSFWSSLSGVCNALDNVQARLYVDQRCVFYKKSLLESGTLGTKGNVQVVVPHLTESYGSSRDPPEKSIPICTLKNFPYMIEHTIQWARDQFEGYFKLSGDEVNNYVSRPEQYVEDLRRQGIGTMRGALKTVYNCLVAKKPKSFADCIRWARLEFEESYSSSIKQLLFSCPEDMVDSNNVPFWSGTKRCPKPITFDVENPLHLGFVYHGAMLYAEMFGLDASSVTMEGARGIVAAVDVPAFEPKRGVKVATTDEEASSMGGTSVENDDEQAIEDYIASLAKAMAEETASLKLYPVEFEKDDDANHHIDFITACSNLRATNYSIEPADRHETKRIAGKIMPAIATTTAYVTATQCIELVKLVCYGYTELGASEENAWIKPKDSSDDQSKKQEEMLEVFKNGFVNLGLPFFAFSEPIAPARNDMGGGRYWTLWDRFDIDLGEELTLEGLLQHFKDNFALEIVMISCGVSFLYSSFTSMDKLRERMPMKMSDIAKAVGKVEFHEKQQYLVMEVCCNDLEGNDVDVPYIRYRFRW